MPATSRLTVTVVAPAAPTWVSIAKVNAISMALNTAPERQPNRPRSDEALIAASQPCPTGRGLGGRGGPLCALWLTVAASTTVDLRPLPCAGGAERRAGTRLRGSHCP